MRERTFLWRSDEERVRVPAEGRAAVDGGEDEVRIVLVGEISEWDCAESEEILIDGKDW